MRSCALIVLLFASVCGAQAQRCGKEGDSALCATGFCCSQYGYCGATIDYCGVGCQSRCPITSIITSTIFDQMLPHRNRSYTYKAFIAAADAFTGFGTTGDLTTQKSELAAFLAQTSHETTGYFYMEEINKTNNYCDPSPDWPCAPNQKYYGRGPIQISHNYNYGPAGRAPQINYNLLKDPDAVARDATISFKTAIWFWMTQQSPKPSCHNVITGLWTPSAADRAAGRVPGYGTITNIINGGFECGKGTSPPEELDRVGFYTKYREILGVSSDVSKTLYCNHQKAFGLTTTVVVPESIAA